MHLVIIHNFFLFWYECFSWQMQSLKSCGRLSQLGSSSPPRDRTSLNHGNDKLKLLCISRIQIGEPICLPFLTHWISSYSLKPRYFLVQQYLTYWIFCSIWYLFTLLVGHFAAFNIWELSPFYLQHVLLLYTFSLKCPTLPYFICWFLFCSWNLGNLPYWVSQFSTKLCFSLFYPLAFLIFFVLSCSLFSLKCPTKVPSFSSFF